MVELLGYLSYVFITVFNPLQLFFMLRRKTVNLGALPLISLTIGLALLSLSFYLTGGIPLYAVIGNALSFIFALVNTVVIMRSNAKAPEPFLLQLQDGTILKAEVFKLPEAQVAAAAPAPLYPSVQFDTSQIPGSRSVDQMREHFSGEVDSTIGRMEGHLAAWKDNGFPPNVSTHERPTADESLKVDLS